MKIFILIGFFNIFCLGNSKPDIIIKKITVYNYFEKQGFTSHSAYSKFSELETAKTPSTLLNNNQTNIFQTIIDRSKEKKIFPGKTGNLILFAKIEDYNGKIHKVLIIKNVIRNFTNKKDYWIKNNDDITWLHDFISKLNSH
tara:strand:+ start:1778 stop:2203 length:426 start_codon:yes stop_codon:yes gene_type:complete